MIVGAGIGAALVLAILLATLCVRRARRKLLPPPISSEDHNLLLLAEREVEALLAKERSHLDSLPIEMLQRKFKHTQDSEVVWVSSSGDSLRATISGQIHINPEVNIYKRDISDYFVTYCKVVRHNGEIMVEIPQRLQFNVWEEKDIEGWTKATLVTVFYKKPISGVPYPF